MPYDLIEMEKQCQELGKWMTLTADNVVGVWGDTNVVIIVVDKDQEGRGGWHVAWIEQQQSSH
jgi:hypothetical protein